MVHLDRGNNKCRGGVSGGDFNIGSVFFITTRFLSASHLVEVDVMHRCYTAQFKKNSECM